MARYDKYDPKDGGFRAPLAADLVKNSAGNPVGVSLDVNGRITPGVAGTSGYVGLLTITRDAKAADVLDVMTHGEIVELAGLAAGTAYYLSAAGVLQTGAPAAGVNGYYVGHTVEATRLVVRFQRIQG